MTEEEKQQMTDLEIFFYEDPNRGSWIEAVQAEYNAGFQNLFNDLAKSLYEDKDK